MSKRKAGEKRIENGRRRFLKGVATAGGAAAIATVSAGVVEGAVEAEAAEEEERGYRLTQHVREYYKTAGM